MKRPLILIVALMVLLAMAVPAGARPGQPPGKSSPLEVTNDTNHFWANVAGDVIVWSVFMTNRGDSSLETVKTYPALTLISGDADDDAELDPGETWVYEYEYTLTDVDLAIDPVTGDSKEIKKAVTVTAGEFTASTTLTVETRPVAACSFEDGRLTYDETDADGPFALLCYYEFDKGYSKFTLTPTVETGRKPINLSMTMRDGIPGNWCRVSDGEGGFLNGSGGTNGNGWRSGDAPIEDYVELPADGVCLQGGAGGETIAVNNPDIFFLAVMGASRGTVTANSCTSLSFQPDGSIADCS